MTDTGSSRRHFLSVFTGLLMTAIGLIMAIPALGYFLSPLRRRSGVAAG
jgi:biopolymer transport protein ExbB/TolQ